MVEQNRKSIKPRALSDDYDDDDDIYGVIHEDRFLHYYNFYHNHDNDEDDDNYTAGVADFFSRSWFRNRNDDIENTILQDLIIDTTTGTDVAISSSSKVSFMCFVFFYV
mmetsp:Transcript_24979/g.59377  ORF Transcript_24979/g.59377 Transcript_24979/m.59377 type:complete len:109 (+) Transcript_24979:20-346(+)